MPYVHAGARGTGTVNVARTSVAGIGRRGRCQARRTHIVKIRLSDEEQAAVEEAAGRVGLTAGAFLARAGVDAAGHRGAAVSEAQREALGELIRVAGLVRRAGVNLNQAVTRLNATGAAGPDLAPAAAYCLRVVRRVDEAAAVIRRSLR